MMNDVELYSPVQRKRELSRLPLPSIVVEVEAEEVGRARASATSVKLYSDYSHTVANLAVSKVCLQRLDVLHLSQHPDLMERGSGEGRLQTYLTLRASGWRTPEGRQQYLHGTGHARVDSAPPSLA